MKQWIKEAKKIRRKCKKLYPDWQDDEYNMGANHFIWGITFQNDIEPSFETWNEIQIYYNRESNKFFLDIEYVKDKTFPLSLEQKRVLEVFKEKLQEFNSECYNLSLFDLNLTEGFSLAEIISKTRALLDMLIKTACN